MRRALKDVEILVVLLSAPFAVSALQPLKPTTPKPQLPELSSYVESADNYCIVSDELPEFARQDYYIDALLFSVPAVVPFFSFFAYPAVQRVYHASLDILSGRTWYAVDGGASRVFDLLPVTNGIVVPSVSVAFGTLTAITIQTLRQRQISICAALNKESCALRNLHAACRTVFADAAYDRERLQTNVLLGEYCTRLIFESRLGVDLDVLERVGASDSELDGITEVLYGARDLPRDDQSQRLFLQNTGFTAMNLVRDLQLFRSERLALLQVPFPAVHWLILSVLASSIVLAYLFETDLQVLQFLDDLQLRYLFTVLASAFLALASLCVDLADPFRGSFTITPSTSQLECIRQYIRGDCASDEANVAAARARNREIDLAAAGRSREKPSAEESSALVQKLAPLVEELDAAILASGFLHETYGFSGIIDDAPPDCDPDHARKHDEFGRNENFTVA